jgi:hypothetical protein
MALKVNWETFEKSEGKNLRFQNSHKDGAKSYLRGLFQNVI